MNNKIKLLQLNIQYTLIKLGLCTKDRFEELLKDDRLYTDRYSLTINEDGYKIDVYDHVWCTFEQIVLPTKFMYYSRGEKK